MDLEMEKHQSDNIKINDLVVLNSPSYPLFVGKSGRVSGIEGNFYSIEVKDMPSKHYLFRKEELILISGGSTVDLGNWMKEKNTDTYPSSRVINIVDFEYYKQYERAMKKEKEWREALIKRSEKLISDLYLMDS